MAKRKSNTPTVSMDELITVFCTLAQFDSSEDDPVTVQEMADELDSPLSENAFTLLEHLADAELIEFERGKVWISRDDVTEENAEDIAVNALNGFEPKSDARKRLEYAAKVAESQEEGAQHLHPMPDARPVIPAEAPVKAEDGSTVTIPVDFDDPSKGRRELDASKGERLISEDTITVKVKPQSLPEIDGLDQFIDAETGDMVYESRIVKLGLVLDEPDSIPACPDGVHHHTWDMAHTAITQSARQWWLGRALSEHEEFKANKGAPAPF